MSPYTKTNERTGPIARAAGWFTDERRQAIQAAFASLLPLLVFAGYLTADQGDVLVSAVQAALQLLQGIVALSLLRASDAARWFNTTGRALAYALAGTVGPLGVAFRWWGDDVAAGILTIAGLSLSALAAFLQIVNVQTLSKEK